MTKTYSILPTTVHVLGPAKKTAHVPPHMSEAGGHYRCLSIAECRLDSLWTLLCIRLQRESVDYILSTNIYLLVHYMDDLYLRHQKQLVVHFWLNKSNHSKGREGAVQGGEFCNVVTPVVHFFSIYSIFASILWWF